MSPTKTIVYLLTQSRDGYVDQYNCNWTPFTVDHFACEETGSCEVCGDTIESGWLCLDGGHEACSEHFQVSP